MPYIQTDDFCAYITDVVTRCKSGDRSGWEDLFQLFLRHIKKLIVVTLLNHGRRDLAKQEDTVSEIFTRFFESALKTIDKLDHPLAVKRWLSEIAYWRTMDFLQSLNTQQHLVTRSHEKKTTSLDEPLHDDSNTTKLDTIAGPETAKPDETALGIVLEAIEALDDPKKWALRLRMIFYNPLNRNEIEQLATYTKKPVNLLTTEIEALMDQLAQKAEAKEKQLDRAARVEQTMKILIGRLLDKKEAGLIPEDLDVYSDENIKAKSERMILLEQAGQQPIVPSNKQVADILCIPKGREGKISVDIKRVRDILRIATKFEVL